MQNKSILGGPIGELHSGSNFGNEEKIQYLEDRIKKLGDICNELNPYLPITPDFKMKLREFNIIDASDPFQVTNALLRLLEDAINELHVFKPLSEEEMRIENLR